MPKFLVLLESIVIPDPAWSVLRVGLSRIELSNCKPVETALFSVNILCFALALFYTILPSASCLVRLELK